MIRKLVRQFLPPSRPFLRSIPVARVRLEAICHLFFRMLRSLRSHARLSKSDIGLISKAMPSNQILNSALKSSENIEKAIGNITFMKERCENDVRFKPHARSGFFV
jgi:hypothetical protein